MSKADTMLEDDRTARPQARFLPLIGVIGALATISMFAWLQITRAAAHLHMDVSMLCPIMWLGFFLVLSSPSLYVSRPSSRPFARNSAAAFLPAGCVLLATGGLLNYAQYRQTLNAPGQPMLTHRQAADASLANDRDSHAVAREIAACGSVTTTATQLSPSDRGRSGSGVVRYPLTLPYTPS